MNYGTVIRVLRTARNLSQKQLADKLGVNPSHVSLLESNRRSVVPETLEKLSSALNVPAHLIVFMAAGKKRLRNISKEDARELGGLLLRVLLDEFPEEQT